MKQKVVVGMSGGVDSSVAAMILKEQGYDVVALFMNNWEEKDELGFCPAQNDFEDVKLVCSKLDIPYYSVNFSQEYFDRVFSYFLDEYKRGRTPNPDVLCNREIKFGAFLGFARGLGASFVATGHYVGVEKCGSDFLLKRAKDHSKDQSYFLHQLNFEQLKYAIFPLENLLKSEVRQMAKDRGLLTHNKKDSTGICFIGERKFKDFLKNYLPAQAGKIVDIHGKVVGMHDGLMYYTIGQRRGLNIGGRADGNGGRWFVLSKDLQNNVLVVSQGEDELLFSHWLKATDMHFVSGAAPSAEFECTAKFRYRQPDQKVRVVVKQKDAYIYFDTPQRAITQGQYAVLYDNDVCLGGGVIEQAFRR